MGFVYPPSLRDEDFWPWYRSQACFQAIAFLVVCVATIIAVLILSWAIIS